MCGVIIILYKIMVKQPVSKLEKIGTLIALTGCIVLVFDSNAEKAHSDEEYHEPQILKGDLIALSCSGLGAIYFLCNQKTLKHLTSNQSMLFIMMYASIIMLVFIPIIFQECEWSFNSTLGVFGWLRPSNFAYSFFVVSFYTGFGCLVSYSIAQ